MVKFQVGMRSDAGLHTFCWPEVQMMKKDPSAPRRRLIGRALQRKAQLDTRSFHFGPVAPPNSVPAPDYDALDFCLQKGILWVFVKTDELPSNPVETVIESNTQRAAVAMGSEGLEGGEIGVRVTRRHIFPRPSRGP
jgi:hypothetical protein